MKDIRKYKGIKQIATESKYCKNGLYYCLAYDPIHDKLITEEFTGNPSQSWIEWPFDLINIGVIDQKMTMSQIREMCEETLRGLVDHENIKRA